MISSKPDFRVRNSVKNYLSPINISHFNKKKFKNQHDVYF